MSLFQNRRGARAKEQNAQNAQKAQRGFSLVELLVAAFILAIGLLGVAMLQAMALRASRGTTNMGTAARIAGQVLDQAELEGRLSWLNITDANRAAPNLATDLSGFSLKYITIPDGEQAPPEYYNFRGKPIDGDSEDPAEKNPFYTVVARRVAIPPEAGESPTGQISDIQVRVTFQDDVDASNKLTTRTFNLSRRIIHG